MTEAEIAAAAFRARVIRRLSLRENAVYEIDGAAGRAALRLHRPGYQSEQAIRSELWWCNALCDAGLPVPRPMSLPSGEAVLRLPSGRLASAVTWVGGAAMGAAQQPLSGTAVQQARLHHDLGRLIARMHDVTDRLALPDWFTRPRWDMAGLLGEAPLWGRFWDHPELTPDQAALVRRARDHLRERLASIGQIGLIHADVLRENVFVNDGSLTLIDFDDSGFGLRPYDLGTVLSQNLHEPALPEIAAALAEGYSAVRSLDAGLLPDVTLMRCCASVGWAMTRLPPGDPIHGHHITRMLNLAAHVLAGRPGWPRQTSTSAASCTPTPKTRL